MNPEIDLADESNAAQSAAAPDRGARAPTASKVEPKYDEKTERYVCSSSSARSTATCTRPRSTMDFVHSGDYAQIKTTAQVLQGLLGDGAYVKRGEQQAPGERLQGRDQLAARRGQAGPGHPALQGPGRDEPGAVVGNHDGPGDARRLLRAQIEDAISADEIFTTLMGDLVEPRRAFIETQRAGRAQSRRLTSTSDP